MFRSAVLMSLLAAAQAAASVTIASQGPVVVQRRVDSNGQPVVVNYRDLPRVPATPPGPLGSKVEIQSTGVLEKPGNDGFVPPPRRSGKHSDADQGEHPICSPSGSCPRLKGKAETVFSFSGINAYETSRAIRGNSDPPDQGLCVGNGYIVELVNAAMRVYSSKTPNVPRGGTTVSLFTFFGTTDNLFDPGCIYDPSTRRWFMGMLRFTGAMTSNYLELAVSLTDDPTGSWMVYDIPATFNGILGPLIPGCENTCIPDFPQMGLDANGVYITSNLFAPANDFRGVGLLALPKKQLFAGTVSYVYMAAMKYSCSNPNLCPGFTVKPAYAGNTVESNGVMHFLSTPIIDNATGVVLWSLTGTTSLDTPIPALTLTGVLLPTSPFANPGGFEKNYVEQMVPFPYGQSISNLGPMKVASLDWRMTSAFWNRQGRLYGVWTTLVRQPGYPSPLGAIYWVRIDVATKTILNQGVYSIPKNSLIFPTVLMPKEGAGIMGFTVVGRDYFPSTGYAVFDGTCVGPIVISGQGQGIFDAECTYSANPRFGDYPAAAVDEEGSMYVAHEFVDQRCNLAEFQLDQTCNGTRAPSTNWATRITKVRVAF